MTRTARRRGPWRCPSAELASILIDWILAAERNGWLNAPSRNHREEVIRDAGEAVRRLHRMREERSLHLTGERYPGHGRRRPLYLRRRQTGPPDDDRRSLLDQIPF